MSTDAERKRAIADVEWANRHAVKWTEESSPDFDAVVGVAPWRAREHIHRLASMLLARLPAPAAIAEGGPWHDSVPAATAVPIDPDDEKLIEDFMRKAEPRASAPIPHDGMRKPNEGEE